ncbi:MAG: TonB-dependent receptor plug domain-containing protein, partial [Caulobacteraceae bacterium]
MNKVFLMTGAALLALCGAGSAFADDAATGAPVDTSSMVEELIVLGQGQTRQVQTVKADDIVRFAPGTSPLKVISKLPSVNFQSADPYGSYEWSTRITVRGFNQNQLGFTLDGVPL